MTTKRTLSGGKKPSGYAVLTGDVVASSKLPPADLQQLMQRLRQAAGRFSKTFPGSVYGKLDVYSGDGWQVLMPERQRSLRAALFFRAVVRSHELAKADTRIAVAWRAVDESALNPERISESTGEAFTESGRALKNMKKRCRLVWQPGPVLARAPFLESAVGLLDELAGRWTARQAQTLALALLDLSQEQIAAALGTRQPTVHQGLQRAGWRRIGAFLDAAENSHLGL